MQASKKYLDVFQTSLFWSFISIQFLYFYIHTHNIFCENFFNEMNQMLMIMSLIFLMAAQSTLKYFSSLISAFCYLKLQELFIWNPSDHVSLVAPCHRVYSVCNDPTGFRSQSLHIFKETPHTCCMIGFLPLSLRMKIPASMMISLKTLLRSTASFPQSKSLAVIPLDDLSNFLKLCNCVCAYVFIGLLFMYHFRPSVL